MQRFNQHHVEVLTLLFIFTVVTIFVANAVLTFESIDKILYRDIIIRIKTSLSVLLHGTNKLLFFLIFSKTKFGVLLYEFLSLALLGVKGYITACFVNKNVLFCKQKS